MLAILNLIPKWLFAAAVVVLAATSCKLKHDNDQLSIEVEKHAARIAELKEGIAATAATAALQATRLEQQARAAEQARSKREKALLADAANASAELERLRGIVSAKTGMYGLRANPAALAPSLDTADSFAELFLESAGRYTDLAATCDRHTNDIKTLIESWPKSNI